MKYKNSSNPISVSLLLLILGSLSYDKVTLYNASAFVDTSSNIISSPISRIYQLVYHHSSSCVHKVSKAKAFCAPNHTRCQPYISLITLHDSKKTNIDDDGKINDIDNNQISSQQLSKDKQGNMIKNKDVNANTKTINTLNTRLLSCDFFSILLACQLLGLVDVLNLQSFWDHGGFFQPITISSISTLNKLLYRDSILSICWLLSCFVILSINRNSNNMIICNPTHPTRDYNYGEANIRSVIDDTLQTFIYFSAFRIVFEILILMFSSDSLLFLSSSWDFVEVVRQEWFTIIFVLTFRILYTKYV